MTSQSVPPRDNARASGLSQFSSGVNPRKVALIDEYGTGDSLLDVGCGNGLYPIATRRPYTRVLQIDLVDRRAVEGAHQPFRPMDAADVASIDSAFDTVLCFDILEHLDDDRGFLASLRGLCRGCLIGSVPADDDAQLRVVGLTHVHHVDKTHRREYSREALVQVLESAGFTDILIVPQLNEGLVYAAHALRTSSWASHLCAKVLVTCSRVLCRLGVFRNASVADWLFVAR